MTEGRRRAFSEFSILLLYVASGLDPGYTGGVEQAKFFVLEMMVCYSTLGRNNAMNVLPKRLLLALDILLKEGTCRADVEKWTTAMWEACLCFAHRLSTSVREERLLSPSTDHLVLPADELAGSSGGKEADVVMREVSDAQVIAPPPTSCLPCSILIFVALSR